MFKSLSQFAAVKLNPFAKPYLDGQRSMPLSLDCNVQTDTPTLFNIRHVLHMFIPSIWNTIFLYNGSYPEIPSDPPLCYV